MIRPLQSRLWRKTRQPSRSWMGCIGADPNRNYGYKWGGEGASRNPCAETFRGESAFSEPEVKSETDYILNNFRGRLSAFLAVHAYGQYFLYPWVIFLNVSKEIVKIAKFLNLFLFCRAMAENLLQTMQNW